MLLLYYCEGQCFQQVVDLFGLSDVVVCKWLLWVWVMVCEEMLCCFGDFVCSLVFSVVFVIMVVLMVLVVVFGMVSVVILIGIGIGIGKFGLGGVSLFGGVVMGLLGVVVSQSYLFGSGFDWGVVVGGMVGGVVGSYFGGCYLMCYVEIDVECVVVCGFVYYSIFIVMLMCMVVFVLIVLQVMWYWLLIVLVIGLVVVNYQCLVLLQWIMVLMIVCDVVCYGCSGLMWIYQWMYGGKVMMVVNLLMFVVIVGVIVWGVWLGYV